jgi:hypothetical protein
MHDPFDKLRHAVAHVCPILFAGLAACSNSPASVTEATAYVNSAVTGGDSANVTFATSLPERAVG